MKKIFYGMLMIGCVMVSQASDEPGYEGCVCFSSGEEILMYMHPEFLYGCEQGNLDIDNLPKSDWFVFKGALLASSNGHVELGETLLSKVSDDFFGRDILCDLDNDLFVNLSEHFLCPALRIACEKGTTKVVTFLLERGVDPNAVSFEDGTSCLITAATHGNLEIVEALLEFDADIEFAGQNGRTAIRYAANNGHFDIVKKLIDSGANFEKALFTVFRYGVLFSSGQVMFKGRMIQIAKDEAQYNEAKDTLDIMLKKLTRNFYRGVQNDQGQYLLGYAQSFTEDQGWDQRMYNHLTENYYEAYMNLNTRAISYR